MPSHKMNLIEFIFSFLVLMGVVGGVVIFFLKKLLFKDIENAKNSLYEQAEAARLKQAELNKKIKEADEELAKRRQEADNLTKKMLSEAEDKVKLERESMVNKARLEGEEIITKAQMTRDKIRKEIEVEMELKAIGYGVEMLNSIMEKRTRGALDAQLVEEFLQGLEKVEMGHINLSSGGVELTTTQPLEASLTAKLQQLLNTKLKQTIAITYKQDPAIMGGAILRIGTLGLDGSLRNMIKEAGAKYKQRVEGAAGA